MGILVFLITFIVLTIGPLSNYPMMVAQSQVDVSQFASFFCFYGNNSVGESFVSRAENLEAVDVAFGPLLPENTSVVFHLRAADQEIRTVIINTSNMMPNQYNRFSFAQISDSDDRRFYFEIDSPTSPRPICVPYAISPNTVPSGITYFSQYTYLDHYALVDGKQTKGNLAFRAYSDTTPAVFLYFTIPYVTIPFIGELLLGNGGATRFNVLGVLWFVTMTIYLTVTFFRSNNILTFKEKLQRFVLHDGLVSGLFVLLFHDTYDEAITLQMLYVGMWKITLSDLLRFKVPVYTVIALIFAYFITNRKQFKSIFKFDSLSFCSLIGLIAWYPMNSVLNIGDYTLYTGFDRLWRYWMFYPETYIFLSILMLSILRRKTFLEQYAQQSSSPIIEDSWTIHSERFRKFSLLILVLIVIFVSAAPHLEELMIHH